MTSNDSSVGNKLSRAFITSILLIAKSQADLVLTCTVGGTLVELVNYATYVACGDACTCLAFELFCLRDPSGSGVYSLIAETYENAQSCTIPECLCNSQENWQFAGTLTGDVVSNKNTFPVLPPAAFQAVATSDPSSYEALVLADLSSTNTRGSTIINPANSASFDGGILPSFVRNVEPAVCPVGTSVTCDYYYKMDWTFAISLSIDCIDFTNNVACFGAFVCDCANGHYAIAETMLTANLIPSATSSGASAAVKLEVQAAQVAIEAAEAAAVIADQDAAVQAAVEEEADREAQCQEFGCSFPGIEAESISAPADPVVTYDKVYQAFDEDNIYFPTTKPDIEVWEWVLIVAGSAVVLCIILNIIRSCCKRGSSRSLPQTDTEMFKISKHAPAISVQGTNGGGQGSLSQVSNILDDTSRLDDLGDISKIGSIPPPKVKVVKESPSFYAQTITYNNYRTSNNSDSKL